MPSRSASDGGGNGSLFRTVFARSPLGQSTSWNDTSPPVPSDDGGISRTSSWESRERRDDLTGLAGSSSLDQIQSNSLAARKRSHSHRERKRPSISLPKFSLQLTTDIKVASPVSPMSESFDLSSSSWEESCGRILHHGEAQVSSSGWRKKYEYLVMTENYLLRFKTAKKAAEVFPWILPAQAHMYRPDSASSISSLQELESLSGRESPTEMSSAKFNAICLQDIIATQLLSDSRAKLGVELFLQSHSHKPSASLSIFIDRINGQSHWIETVSAAARCAQMKNESSLSPALIQTFRESIGKDSFEALEQSGSRLFLVHRRQTHATENSTSGFDEITRDSPSLLYLLVGNYQIHLITIPKAQRTSSRSLSECSKVHVSSYGIVSLSCVSVSDKDDAFELVFRKPQRPAVSLELASVQSHRIAQAIHAQHGKVLPHWRRDPYLFRVPHDLQHQLLSSESTISSTVESFNTTLEAYCSAFGIDKRRLRYKVELNTEDAPCITLLAHSTSFDQNYSMLEIIAFMRALRFNEYFGTISFAGTSLDRLAESYDNFGDEHILIKPKMGPSPLIKFEEMKHSSMLTQELTAIIMSSRKLRRLDFSNTIIKTPNAVLEQKGEEKGCCIAETIYPLCIRQNTNVDWIILNGLHLSRYDFEYIVGMVEKKDCHLRALELSGCQLDSERLKLLLMKLSQQRNTLEVINISNNPGRLIPDISFPLELMECQSMRKLDLSRLQFSPDPVSLLSFEVLSAWRLEELRLTKTRVNEQTLTTLTYYLESKASRPLKQLLLNECQINENGIATILHALNYGYNGDRKLHLDISENWIRAFEPLSTAIRDNITPTSLSLRAAEFVDEHDFSQFVDAVKVNSSLRHLDISETQLGFRIDDDMSESLRAMFAENTTLEELDVSGENTRLETNTLGAGFFESLRGLEHNRVLKVLRIQHQRLELQGANSLVHVLETNQTLQEIHCEHNRIPLTGFTLLNIALDSNNSLLFLSDMEDCKQGAIQTLQARMMESIEPCSPTSTMKGHMTMKSKELLGRLSKSPREKYNLAPGLLEMKEVLNRKWNEQQQKLRLSLERNRRIAAGEITDFDSNHQSEPTNPANVDTSITPPDELGIVLGPKSSGDNDSTDFFVTEMNQALNNLNLESASTTPSP